MKEQNPASAKHPVPDLSQEYDYTKASSAMDCTEQFPDLHKPAPSWILIWKSMTFYHMILLQSQTTWKSICWQQRKINRNNVCNEVFPMI